MLLDRRRQCLVLTFHRVGRQSRIQRSHVEWYFRYLTRKYTVLRPSELCRGSGHKRVALVTVDDCHADVYETVFPVADRLRIPITVCVPTDFFFRNEWLWFDKVNWGVRKAKRHADVEVGDWRFATGSAEGVRNGLRYLKYERPERRDWLIDKVLSDLGILVPAQPVEEHRPVSKAEMTEMLASGLVELCAHTRTHPIMTCLSDEELRAEMELPKQELEAFCHQPILSFCYPNGHIGDFDKRTRRFVADAGYKIAFTSVEGLNRPQHMDPLELRRIHAHARYSVFLKVSSGLGVIQRKLGLAHDK